jgi:hypothetical protein
VTELGEDQLLEGEAQRAAGAGQHEDDAPGAKPCERARKERGGADLLVREHAEELAEAGDHAVEERLDRLRGDVARRDAGAAGEDHRTHALPRQRRLEPTPDLVGLVATIAGRLAAAARSSATRARSARSRGARCYG